MTALDGGTESRPVVLLWESIIVESLQLLDLLVLLLEHAGVDVVDLAAGVYILHSTEKKFKKEKDVREKFFKNYYYDRQREEWGKYMIWSLQMWVEKYNIIANN